MGKALEKQTKSIKDQGKKQIDALESLKSSDKQSQPIKEFISKEKQNPEIAKKLKMKKD